MSTLAHFFDTNFAQDDEIASFLSEGLRQCGVTADSFSRIMLIPPDGTRAHSRGGFITSCLYRLLGSHITGIIPALGTHAALNEVEYSHLFSNVPHNLCVDHAWRRDAVEIERLDASYVQSLFGFSDEYCSLLKKSGFDASYPIQLNRHLLKDGFKGGSSDFLAPDLLISIGQVVPHEVVGMANHAKNIFVGLGGKEAIDKSHFLSALYGLERIIGTVDNPVRALFDEASKLAADFLPPVLYIQTVVDSDSSGKNGVRGIFMGFGRSPFEQAAQLSQSCNITMLEKPLAKAVAWMDPAYIRSTWIANKAIYRLRKALAPGGELIIMAPGVNTFGEDSAIDSTIRRYGYRCADSLLHLMSTQNPHDEHSLLHDLCGAAHLIHGCPDGRFSVSYCTGSLLQADIESIGFSFIETEKAQQHYMHHKQMKSGFYTSCDGDSFYFVSQPALGLWCV